MRTLAFAFSCFGGIFIHQDTSEVTHLTMSPVSSWCGCKPRLLSEPSSQRGALQSSTPKPQESLHFLLPFSFVVSPSPHLSILPSVCPQGSPQTVRCVSVKCYLLPFQVFQRRNTGQLDFFKRWRTYVEGFGDPMKEFWLGMIFEKPGRLGCREQISPLESWSGS